MKFYLLLFVTLVYSCTQQIKKQEIENTDFNQDTTEFIRGFIYGLWSKDSGNVLYNEGFYFKPDGTVEFVAAGANGKWEITTKKTIKIIYSNFNEENSAELSIDSISDSRMILSDSKKKYLFRKVPFGMNEEGSVLKGFSGSISKGESKSYDFEIPTAKKISLKLNSQHTDLVFNVFDTSDEITSVGVREWTAIMVRSGQYRVTIHFPGNSKEEDEANFDLKIFAY